MRLYATLVLAMMLARVAWAQQPATTNVPRLVCDEPVFDFGTRDPSETVEHTFVIRNAGTLTLEITRVHPGCGCTVANISEKNVPPGGESHITARLSLQGRSGPQQKTITVDSNDPNQPQIILTMKGVAGAALNVQPPQITTARIAPGTRPTATVFVSSADGAPFKITAVESTSDQLLATVDPLVENTSYRVNLALKEPLEGVHHSVVIVRTDHPKRGVVEIPVHFATAREIVVAPRVILFDAPGSDPVSRFVLLRNADGSPLELDGIEPPDGSVRVETQPYAANGIRVQLYNLVPSAAMNGRVLRIHPRGSEPIDVPIRINGIGG